MNEEVYHSPRILIVEDEKNLRILLAEELRHAGYEVFTAADGENGFALVQDVHPSLIITDVLMPKMNGNELLKKVRASEGGQNIPFLVLSARSKMKDYFDLMSVSAFISKPLKSDELLTKVKNILDFPKENRHPRSENFSPPPGDQKRRVLVLEDDIWLINIFQTIFEQYGYTIRIAHTAGEALEEAVLFAPDAIVARHPIDDLRIGQFIDLLREMSHLKYAPVFIYSNSIRDEIREEVLKAGATDFIIDGKGIKVLKRVNEWFAKDEKRAGA